MIDRDHETLWVRQAFVTKQRGARRRFITTFSPAASSMPPSSCVSPLSMFFTAILRRRFKPTKQQYVTQPGTRNTQQQANAIRGEEHGQRRDAGEKRRRTGSGAKSGDRSPAGLRAVLLQTLAEPNCPVTQLDHFGGLEVDVNEPGFEAKDVLRSCACRSGHQVMLARFRLGHFRDHAAPEQHHHPIAE